MYQGPPPSAPGYGGYPPQGQMPYPPQGQPMYQPYPPQGQMPYPPQGQPMYQPYPPQGQPMGQPMYQPYPPQGQPAPYQRQPMPKPLPMPQRQRQPQPRVGISPLSPHLAAFNAHYEADETIECSPSDVPKELRLLNSRGNDHYPQGKGNCSLFLKECQAKGLSFKIQVEKTRPYYTWYYELASASPPKPSSTTEGECYRALYSFRGENPGDLSFRKGDILYVMKKEGSWWEGMCDGKYGILPSNYVTKV